MGSRRGAHLARDLVAVTEQHERRDALDGEPLTEPRRGVDVDLHQLASACELRGELLEDRAHRAARPAPRRPEVDEHRERSPLSHVSERGVIGIATQGNGDLQCPTARLPVEAAGTRLRVPHDGQVTTARLSLLTGREDP